MLLMGKSTFVVPSTCFVMDQYIRISCGNNINALREGLGSFKGFLGKYR